MRGIIVVAVAAVLNFSLITNSASATEPCCTYKKVVCDETVVVWVAKQVPYTVEIVKYDHCGKPYTVCVTCYKDVSCPVQKCVPVKDGDTSDTLAARVFQAECEAYPEAIRMIAEGKVTVQGRRVVITG